MRALAVALVHHPVLGRQQQELTTAITTLDLHDLARSSRCYGLEAVYVVHPFDSQRQLAERIRHHWVEGSGRRRIPDRGLALELLRMVPTLDAAITAFARAQGHASAEVWTTAARADQGAELTPFRTARELLSTDGGPVVLCFGTGWGLTAETLAQATHRLEPIRAERATGYNHLSVRAACAITLDRLLGPL